MEKEPHPWGEFLNVRLKVIIWMTNEMKYDDAKIAENLSMTEWQVYLIKRHLPLPELPTIED